LRAHFSVAVKARIGLTHDQPKSTIDSLIEPIAFLVIARPTARAVAREAEIGCSNSGAW
jgi:hypothetical protein